MKKLLMLILLGALFSGRDAWAIDERRFIKKAERFSREKNWDKAREIYREALQQAPDSAVLNYNEGVCSYRKGDFESAKNSFIKGLATDNKTLEAAASYNSGDALFKKAKQLQDSDVNAAIDALRQSLRHYRRALELSPRDRDARYNYELADKVLKVLLQKKPPQAGGGGQNQQKQQSQQNQQSQDQKSQEQKQEQQKQPQQQERPKDASGQVPDGQQKPRASAGAEQSKDQLSKEEAQMLVASYGEEGPRQEINREQIPNEKQVQKNW